MKKITQKQIKEELIKIINKSKIEEIMYEPRYQPSYMHDQFSYGKLEGSTITILTKIK